MNFFIVGSFTFSLVLCRLTGPQANLVTVRSRRGLGSGCSLCTLLVVGLAFNLDTHAGKTELVDANACENRAVVRQPLLEVADAGHDRLFAEVGEIQADLVDLAPALAASVLQAVLDVGKGLVDFLVEVRRDLAGLRVPSA